MTSIKPRRFGITLRIALLAWLITLVTVSIFVTVIIPEQKRTFLENLESKADGVAVSIRDVAAGAVVAEDYGTLVEHCLQIVKGDKSIDYVVITKNNGDSWIHEKSGWRCGHLAKEWNPETRSVSSGIGVVSEFNRRVFHYSQPFDYSGIQWGWVHVGLSLESYDRSVAVVYHRTFVLALLCILLSLLASGLYARFLVRPILTVQSVVRRVAHGDLSARAVIHTGDEVELLADSVNVMTGSLLHRDKILGSVRFAAQQFLAATDWRTVAGEVLTRIGEAAEISRAYVFENHAGPDGSLLTSERFEYAAPGQAGLVHTPKLQNLPWHDAGLEAWAEALNHGRPFSGLVRSFSPAEQARLAPQQSQSVILVPIHSEGAWWGYLGLDDCVRERVWTDAEVVSLRALADMLGAAIARQRAQDALVEAKETLERRVTERTQELQEQVRAKDRAHAELAEAQHKLIDASRRAGMAEVATGVLHNVGNVLNSVNVSVNVINDKLRGSQGANLARVAALLNSHRADLGAYLTSDPKGRLVPDFISHLATALEEERDHLVGEMQALLRNVEHIKEIVAMQQSYAKVAGVTEDLPVTSLVEDAVRMNEGAFLRHGVVVQREFQEVPPVRVDKHKVLQILVNLLRNAKYAMDASGKGDRVLSLGICRSGNGRVKVTVRDNGVGIAPENLTRIFAHGFTTKKDGHGFGLHSGALAAKEMGGSLQAFSAGSGTGATFVLELPAAGEHTTTNHEGDDEH